MMNKKCLLERLAYTLGFFSFAYSAFDNNFKEWFDFFIMAFAVYSFFNPYFCKK